MLLWLKIGFIARQGVTTPKVKRPSEALRDAYNGIDIMDTQEGATHAQHNKNVDGGRQPTPRGSPKAKGWIR